MKFKNLLLIVLFTGFASCDLEEELRKEVDAEGATEIITTPAQIQALVQGVYNSLNGPMTSEARWWALNQHSTDETVGPTRGGDWDDGGVWRVYHDHTWTDEHPQISDTFSEILQTVFTATNALRFEDSLTVQQVAEVKFLRAWAMYCVLDGWGQVPVREPGSDLRSSPEVLTSAVAFDRILTDLEEIVDDLPTEETTLANADAAKFLQMKMYLNKGVYENRASPTFSTDDMNQVISLADELINSGTYTLDDNYFDNFEVRNDELSSENIWELENIGSIPNGNNIRSRWRSTMHYNQIPDGWNGFTTLSDFYDSFEAGDERLEGETSTSGMTAVQSGFLIGPQDGPDKEGVLQTVLKDRNGNDLSFTREVALIESGGNLEITGIRVVKYVPDVDNAGNGNAENNTVLFRYADVLLMKAEAILRGGTSSETALELVNELRQERNASVLTDVDLDELLAERGREFYWEAWRRQDLIRFGKFLGTWQLKPEESGSERLLFPIPAAQVALNPNLNQNPGY